MHTQTQTHTHTLYFSYHIQNWLYGPQLGDEPAEGSKTGGAVGSGDTNLMTPDAWPTQCIHSYSIHCVQTTDTECTIGIYMLGQRHLILEEQIIYKHYPQTCFTNFTILSLPAVWSLTHFRVNAHFTIATATSAAG